MLDEDIRDLLRPVSFRSRVRAFVHFVKSGMPIALFDPAPRKAQEQGRFFAYAAKHSQDVAAQPIDAPMIEARSIEQILVELKPLVGRVDAAGLLAAMLELNVTEDWRMPDVEDSGCIAFVEYLAELALSMNLFDGHLRPAVTSADVAEVQKLVQLLFEAVEESWLVAPTPEGSARKQVLRYHMYVRYPGYSEHVIQDLELLAPRVDDTLTEAIGWGIADALQTVAAIRLVLVTRNADVARGNGLNGHTFSFTLEELQRVSDLPDVRMRGVLEAMTLERSSARELPTPTPTIARAPLIRIGDESWLAPTPALLPYAIRARAEELLMRDAPDRWNQYSRRRSAFLESRAMELLTDLLRPDASWTNLHYPGGEIDGLLLLDDHAFVVEAKSSALSLPVRRAAQESMIEEISEIVATGRDQTSRAINYFRNAAGVSFTVQGQELHIDSGALHFAHRILVTFDTMDAYVANWAVLDSIIGTDAGEVPIFACSLADLRVFRDLIEWPCQFVHYLEKRDRLNLQRRITATEEMDWLGFYLQHNLDIEPVLDSDMELHVKLADYTPAISRYYVGAIGGAKPVALPRQRMPWLMRRMINESVSNRSPGHLRSCVLALDVPMRERWKLFRAYARQRLRSALDGRVHDIKLLAPGARTGISVHFGAASKLPLLLDQMAFACAELPGRHGLGRWLSVAAVTDDPWICACALAADSSRSCLLRGIGLPAEESPAS